MPYGIFNDKSFKILEAAGRAAQKDAAGMKLFIESLNRASAAGTVSMATGNFRLHLTTDRALDANLGAVFSVHQVTTTSLASFLFPGMALVCR